MSGLEPIAVVGLISSIITIIETSRHLYDAASNAKGLPEAFRIVSIDVSLALEILRNCKQVQERANQEYEATTSTVRKLELQRSAEAVKPVMQLCEDYAARLQDIFKQVMTGDGATRLERYSKAARAVMPGKQQKVESLMKSMLEQLQLLQIDRIFKTAVQEKSENLTEAIDSLSALPSSLPEENGRYHHSGAGPMNLNLGPGSMTSHTISGGSNNSINYGTGEHNPRG